MEDCDLRPVFVDGSFDSVMARELRLLQEASGRGPLHVLLWSDSLTEQRTGRPPTFPEAERRYVLEAIRYVQQVSLCAGPADADGLPLREDVRGALWVVDPLRENPASALWCHAHGVTYDVIPEHILRTIPADKPQRGNPAAAATRVLVTGCYDWFHSGHVRFFEEVSQLGQLYVVVGHDANIRLLKGDGHPMFPDSERRYIVGSVRHVHQALVSSGDGWLDAEPEIERIRPDIYAVNEDGDRPEKRDYCATHGIEYCVLKRVPKEGLPKRQSTDLRGF